MSWDEVYIAIETPDRFPMMQDSTLEPFRLDHYMTMSEIDPVEGWFWDLDGNGVVNSGDQIVVTGMDRNYEGTIVHFTWGGIIAGSASLPAEFRMT
jgi:hypothetical protein